MVWVALRLDPELRALATKLHRQELVEANDAKAYEEAREQMWRMLFEGLAQRHNGPT